jgi:hypothetical protein
MDCPACGVANSPETSKCGCGYEVVESESGERPWPPINLAWRQKLAAYWSISWPALIVSLWIGGWYVNNLADSTGSGEIAGHKLIIFCFLNVPFFVVQAFLTGRLVRKEYRTFRVVVLRYDDDQSRRLSIREATMVWLWVFAAQFVFSAICAFLRRPVMQIGSLSILIQFLVVGPNAVSFALRRRYPKFQLQAQGLRYV